MRNSDELQDKEWEWVAQSYRATPTASAIDTDALVDLLMQEVDQTTSVTMAASSIAISAATQSAKTQPATAHPSGDAQSQSLDYQRRTRDLPYRRVMPLPLWGGFVAALILVFVGGLWVGRTSMRNSLLASLDSQSSEMPRAQENTTLPTVTSTPPAERTVQFVLSAPHASHVTLVGDFNGWDIKATPMASRPGSGLWTVSVPLPAGRHVYAFVVDGDEWVADPAAPQVAVDAFGSPNSVVIVGGSI